METYTKQQIKMRVLMIDGCEQAKLAYSEFCADNDLPDCFSTIVYFMESQNVIISVSFDMINKVYTADFKCLDTCKLVIKTNFEERHDVEFYIAKRTFEYIEHQKGVRSW